jgi:outer membrane protein OmpA-like peptidoglycan-associated protein
MYEEQDFGSDREFRDSKGNWITVEGRHYKISYRVKGGVKPQAAVAVIRNYIQAIQRAGGEVVFQGPQNAYMKMERGGIRTWARVYATGGEWYTLVVVEEGALEQVVEANAEEWKNDIRQTGKVALYGIYFDTGKSDVKPESEPTINEIAKLLRDNPTFKLHVVGHTDNVCDLDYNLRLSKARADAVVSMLVRNDKIAAERLKAHGVGPLAPVASNQTEEGRANNRRVELVEQ